MQKPITFAMAESARPRKHVESPCVRNCCLDADDICMGCHRSLTEICRWHDAPDEERLEILTRCRDREGRRALATWMPKKDGAG